MTVTRTLREAIDINQLFLLQARCFPDQWTQQTLQESLNNTAAINFYLYDGINLIGYIHCLAMGSELEVICLAITPEVQGKRLADNLINVVKDIDYIDKIFLEVNVNNENAIKFYTRHKFEKVNKRKKYYRNGDDAIIMMLKMI